MTLLDVVAEARTLRDRAQAEYVSALVRARTAHSWTEIGRAAGLTRAGARYLVRRGRGDIDGHGNTIERGDTEK